MGKLQSSNKEIKNISNKREQQKGERGSTCKNRRTLEEVKNFREKGEKISRGAALLWFFGNFLNQAYYVRRINRDYRDFDK